MKTTEVVAALIWDGGRFLICQRAEHKARGLLWEFPGGKVESGETGEQALARECREELAVSVSVKAPYMDVLYNYPDLRVHLTLFEASILRGRLRKREHQEMRWVTPQEAGAFAFCPADRAFVERLERDAAAPDPAPAR
jgi:8-oxo-dGTP diphosphatase